MKRREFIGLVGGAAAWPIATRAQQDTRVRLVAFLSAGSKSNTAAQLQAVFVDTLLQLGWKDGQNIRIDERWADNDADRPRD